MILKSWEVTWSFDIPKIIMMSRRPIEKKFKKKNLRFSETTEVEVLYFQKEPR